MSTRITIELMRELARERGGRCMSKEYIDRYTKLDWRCEKGHDFELTYMALKSGGWCQRCASTDRRAAAVELMHEWAAERGGKCLSKEYILKYKPWKWQCKKGHVFTMSRVSVFRGIWCLICKKEEEQQHSLVAMQKLAAHYGGKCISKTYIYKQPNMEWQCKKGHQFVRNRQSVKEGYWCDECKKEERRNKWIKKITEYASKHKGKCIPETVIDGETPTLMQCNKGHQWKTTPFSMLHSETWCPHCYGNVPHTIAFMREVAKERGGKCISKSYINSQTLLKWQCAKKHIWSTSYHIIRSGSWCPKCGYEIVSQKVKAHMAAQKKKSS